MNSRTKQMVYAALLTALAIIIPIQFSFLRVYFPPFSATLASHVPMFMAMFISPFVAIIVGVGSTLGFFLTGLPLPIVVRAATHILVGYIGAKIIQKNKNYVKAVVITAPIHGLAEALVVIPFVGFADYKFLVFMAGFIIIHHTVDAIISFVIIKALARARRKSIYNTFLEVKEAA
ncbi:ECF transporter S component [Clostridium vincentii]|uniref:Niacin transporter NiaX n=1 Tax=Clostridium vincentii TaxID=52704 RepID=A0A2T0BHL6_9CLOT|nr:ECF transporter S component [Clostridium vincentii]PRR83389.1 Niacin transporter NiaX [Clostridium vincentii]